MNHDRIAADITANLLRERDEARAEVERLKAKYASARCALDEWHSARWYAEAWKALAKEQRGRIKCLHRLTDEEMT